MVLPFLRFFPHLYWEEAFKWIITSSHASRCLCPCWCAPKPQPCSCCPRPVLQAPPASPTLPVWQSHDWDLSPGQPMSVSLSGHWLSICLAAAPSACGPWCGGGAGWDIALPGGSSHGKCWALPLCLTFCLHIYEDLYCLIAAKTTAQCWVSVQECFTAELQAKTVTFPTVTFPTPERDCEGVCRNVHLAALCLLAISLFSLHLRFPKFWSWRAI